jgi:cell division protein FtsX
MEAFVVPLVAIAISLATFLYTVITNASKAESERVAKLEARASAMELRLTECEEDRQDLREKILDLKRKTA